MIQFLSPKNPLLRRLLVDMNRLESNIYLSVKYLSPTKMHMETFPDDINGFPIILFQMFDDQYPYDNPSIYRTGSHNRKEA